MYNKINTTSKDPNESQIEQVVDLTIHQTMKSQQYNYPVMNDQMTYWQALMGDRLGGISLVPTVKFSIFCNLILFFYLGLFGLIISCVTINILEYKVNYSNECGDEPQCTLDFFLDDMFPIPSYIYYELDNFYSNDRIFVQSISKDQMMGYDINGEQECLNAYELSSMSQYQNTSAAGFMINLEQANPCGLAVKYRFNDSFTIFNGEGVKQVNQTNLTLPMYANNFQRHPFWQFTQWLDVLDEHLQNWLTVQVTSSRFVLWGVIDENMPSGSYKLYISNNYPTSIYGGSKTLIISNSSELGSKNMCLSIILVVTSLIYLLNAGLLRMRNKLPRITQIAPQQLSQ